MRLLKLWNEALPKIRGGKAPLVSLHIPLLQLAAEQPCDSPMGKLPTGSSCQEGLLVRSAIFVEGRT